MQLSAIILDATSLDSGQIACLLQAADRRLRVVEIVTTPDKLPAALRRQQPQLIFEVLDPAIPVTFSGVQPTWPDCYHIFLGPQSAWQPDPQTGSAWLSLPLQPAQVQHCLDQASQFLAQAPTSAIRAQGNIMLSTHRSTHLVSLQSIHVPSGRQQLQSGVPDACASTHPDGQDPGLV